MIDFTRPDGLYLLYEIFWEEDSLMVNFGEYLVSLREKNGLSIQELSRRSEVAASYIDRIEKGKKLKTVGGKRVPSVPSPKILERLAPHLNVSFTTLMKAAGHIKDEAEGKPELLEIINAGLARLEGREPDLVLCNLLAEYIKAAIEIDSDKKEELPQKVSRVVEMALHISVLWHKPGE